jgi:hypothetical protein
MSPKSIYLTNNQYQQICEAARKCGYRVQRGRGSQLAQFVVVAANTACTGQVTPVPPSQVETSESLAPSK